MAYPTLFSGCAQFMRQAADFVLPPRCAVSGDIVDRPGVLAPAAWAGLRFIGAPFCAGCGHPFDFEVESADGALCGGCLRDPPPYRAARAALAYDDASRGVILRFKHGDQLHVAPALAALMIRAAGEMLADPAVVLVPVPLHRWRLLRRRYNQAGVLAQAIARQTGRLCLVDALVRRRATPTQGHLGFGARHKNVKRAFAVTNADVLRGKPVVLIDDVFTSGATVKECAKALLAAGAASVDVLTLARVV